jgi:hypothetical protein
MVANCWYDEENNFNPVGQSDEQINRVDILREELANEFWRCKIYANMDQAFDDADTALGFLSREGFIDLRYDV